MDRLVKMANVGPRHSGLSKRLFFSWSQYSGVKLPLGPRFKIEISPSQLVSVNLDNPRCPRGLSAMAWHQILRFVSNNRSAIIAFWEGELTDSEFHAALKPMRS
jgi:hypothetical protein